MEDSCQTHICRAWIGIQTTPGLLWGVDTTKPSENASTSFEILGEMNAVGIIKETLATRAMCGSQKVDFNEQYPEESTMISKFLFINALLFAIPSWAESLAPNCVQEGLVRIDLGKPGSPKLKEIKGAYCYDLSQRSFFTNGCQAHDYFAGKMNPQSRENIFNDYKKKCPLMVSSRPFLPRELHTRSASPAFNLCSRVGGTPYFAKIKLAKSNPKEQWSEIEICVGPHDEFIDLNTLYKHYVPPSEKSTSSDDGAAAD